MTPIRTAMLLAAGQGNRMQELTRSIPKPLLRIGNYTLLDIQLMKLKNAGIKKVVINLFHLPEKIIAHLEQNPHSGIDIHFSVEPELLGTGGGIARAFSYFAEETILLINSDILSDLVLENFLNTYYKSRAIASLTAWPSRDYKNYNLVQYDARHRLAGFQQKDNLPSGQTQTGIFMGYYILTPAAREFLHPHRSSVVTRFFMEAVNQDLFVPVYIHEGTWIDIGTKENYDTVLRLYQSGRINLDRFIR
jgi:mannose-1-phosphate guanylyltransferase